MTQDMESGSAIAQRRELVCRIGEYTQTISASMLDGRRVDFLRDSAAIDLLVRAYFEEVNKYKALMYGEGKAFLGTAQSAAIMVSLLMKSDAAQFFSVCGDVKSENDIDAVMTLFVIQILCALIYININDVPDAVLNNITYCVSRRESISVPWLATLILLLIDKTRGMGDG